MDRNAGSTLTDAISATTTTRMEPVARLVNTELPARYMPAMAITTVTPEMSTARPEVAAAASMAARSPRPAARSSRSRRR